MGDREREGKKKKKNKEKKKQEKKKKKNRQFASIPADKKRKQQTIRSISVIQQTQQHEAGERNITLEDKLQCGRHFEQLLSL